MSQQAIDYYNLALSKTTEKLKIENRLATPKLVKVVINCGFGKDKGSQDIIDDLYRNITVLSGQKPVITKAKKSIASFKLRMGEPIGMIVTLRRKNMLDFLYKLVNLTLPSIRDFRGISRKSIDRSGNLTIGIKEQSVFPELNLNRENLTRGLEICIATKTKNNNEAVALFESLGIPFKKEQ